jgi:hypothetical protein
VAGSGELRIIATGAIAVATAHLSASGSLVITAQGAVAVPPPSVLGAGGHGYPLPARMGVSVADATPIARAASASPIALAVDAVPTSRVASASPVAVAEPAAPIATASRGNREWT